MGFLDNAKRRVTGIRGDALTPEGRHAPARERLEPRLDEENARLPGAVDPEISRMAQAFEALYSPPESPGDRHSLGRTDNDNFFADLPYASDVAAAPGGAASPRRESPASERGTSGWRRDFTAPAEPPGANPKKTTIEMVFDMRRAVDENARTAAMQSQAAQPAHAAQPHPWSDLEPVRQADSGVRFPVETRDAATAASPSLDQNEPDVATSGWSGRPQESLGESAQWSARQRRIHMRMLAGAALALIVGAGVGYMAGKGDPTVSRGAVESSESGMKLRLDRDLRQP